MQISEFANEFKMYLEIVQSPTVCESVFYMDAGMNSAAF